MAISLTRTTVFDVEADVDIEADRVDHTGKEEVLAYVPALGEYREHVIKALEDLGKAIDTGPYPMGIAPASLSEED